MWPDILWYYLRGLPQRICSIDQYELWQRSERGPYLLAHQGEPIAEGTEQWMTHLQTFHQQIYEEEMNRLPEAIKGSGFLERCDEIERLANDVYERLDIISSGGVVFKPGNCQVCYKLVA